MKAIVAPKYNKKIQELSIKLLEKPEIITLWATGACNFRCSYCIQSESNAAKEKEQFPMNQMMSWDTFLRCTSQMEEFGKPLPAVVFCGIGEPLLNPKLPEMIAYLKKNKIASYVELVTNASLLTEEKSLALIDAGLDLMSVSIQGVTEESYQKTCNVKLDPKKIQEQLAYFSSHKKNCYLHIKTVDIALHGRDEYQLFADMFGNIADSIFVDHVFPLFKNVDYSQITEKAKDQYTGETLKRAENYPCALLFHALYVQPDGRIVPCCTSPTPVVLGSIYQTTLKEVWNSSKRRQLLIDHLELNRKKYPACEECVQPEILNSSAGIEKMGLDQMIQSLLAEESEKDKSVW